MLDFEHSSQLQLWLFTPELMEECRTKANKNARTVLAQLPAAEDEKDKKKTMVPVGRVKVEHYARGYYSRLLQKKGGPDAVPSSNENAAVAEEGGDGPWKDHKSNPLLNPAEEEMLVSFYAGKLSSLIGPRALLGKCRRDGKVAATAAVLLRRFYMSNSVMAFDPRSIMVAAAFIATKVEDVTIDVKSLEDGTKEMQAPMTTDEIINAELVLLEGLNFDLMCFHPYKTVLAYTEDLRTFLKSDKGRGCVVSVAAKKEEGGTNEGDGNDGDDPPPVISGEDLRPVHDEAQKLIGDVCVSDIPLLYTPGQIGLAAMIVASEALSARATSDLDAEASKTVFGVAKIDMYRYINIRFEGRSADDCRIAQQRMKDLSEMLKQLKHGKYGCGNYEMDMEALKAVNKKLKKCRVWGPPTKKKKKRKASAMEEAT